MRFFISFLKKSMQLCTVEIRKKDPVGFLVVCFFGKFNGWFMIDHVILGGLE